VQDARGRHRDALRYFDRALASDPSCKEAWNNKGWTLSGLKRVKESRQCFERALKIDPDFKDARSNLDALLKGSPVVGLRKDIASRKEGA
jgi:tetratricopeptide (TPR) repeat protein